MRGARSRYQVALSRRGFPRLLGRAPDWDYDTRRMVRRRILGRTHVPARLNQPLKEQENVFHWVSSFAN